MFLSFANNINSIKVSGFGKKSQNGERIMKMTPPKFFGFFPEIFWISRKFLEWREDPENDCTNVWKLSSMNT